MEFQEQDLFRAFGFSLLFELVALLSGRTSACAQSLPVATPLVTPSVFAGVSGVRTGLDSGRNLSVVAGVDLTVRPASRLHPTLEYRGMYALAKGNVDSLKSNLGGVKFGQRYGRFSPYLDLLVGRQETAYANGGYQVPGKPVFYTVSSSNVFSVGVGADFFAVGNFALKVDLQGQRSSSPVTASGHVDTEVGTIGLVYVFRTGLRSR